MNYPILAASILVSVALLAHAFVGLRESYSVRPADPALERNWVQSLCAFQLVTIDLAVLASLLFALAATDWIPARRGVALAVAGFFASWGLAWLLQLAALRRPAKDYGILGHWIYWFVCGALVFWGAQSL